MPHAENLAIQDYDELLALAKQGDQLALGQLLELHRAYLKVLAERQLDRRLEVRIDASDLIQQTCLSAFASFAQFAGQSEGEFAAWIQTVHEHTIQNAVRDHVSAQKRSVKREESQPGYESMAAGNLARGSSPSRRLMLGESAVRLAAALQTLPDDQREAVRLRYLEDWSLAQIAERMERTKYSVAGLVKRGLVALREVLRESE